jgi:hypothetical protein
MATNADEDFMRRVVATLICAVEDRNWEDIEIAAGALANELGMDVPAPLKAKMQAAFAKLDA